MLEEILNLLNDENTFDLGVKLLESKFDCEVGLFSVEYGKLGFKASRSISFYVYQDLRRQLRFLYIVFPTIEKLTAFLTLLRPFDNKLVDFIH
jgi:hypothetical protein